MIVTSAERDLVRQSSLNAISKLLPTLFQHPYLKKQLCVANNIYLSLILQVVLPVLPKRMSGVHHRYTSSVRDGCELKESREFFKNSMIFKECMCIMEQEIGIDFVM